MKRFFSFLILAVLFTSCDDGDMQEVSFDFDTTSASPCNISGDSNQFFIFKTTDHRALLFKLLERNFSNTVTQDTLNGQRIEVTLGDANKLIYRVYSGNISNSSICSIIPPSSPVVIEERIAAEGTAYIQTDAVKSDIKDDGSSSITDYRHTITFSDITFNLGDGSQRIQSLPAMVYTRRATSFIPFDLTTPLNRCTNKNLIFRFNSTQTSNSQAMVLELSDTAMAELFTDVLDVPKTQYLSNEEGSVNRLTHLFFRSTATNPLTTDYFCSTTTPDFPSVKDIWTGDVGAEIEVITTAVDTDTKRHTITLKGVRMMKGSQFFFLKTNFVFGSFDVTTPSVP